MGACASVLKAMKAEAGAMPPQEQPKEETTAEVVEVKTEKEVKATEGGDDKQKENEKAVEENVGEKVVDDNEKVMSLRSFLNESEAPTKAAEDERISQRETEATVPPVSDIVAPVTPETEKASTSTLMAELSKDEKKMEVTEDKRVSEMVSG